MGMMFTYNLGQCNDWELCKLEAGAKGTISKRTPAHWHLHKNEGGDWVFKTRANCLGKLLQQVTLNYDRLYDEQGKYRG